MSVRYGNQAWGTILIVAAAALLVIGTPATAQDVVLSPVPKAPCCFTNFRFAGTCQVTPRQGQYCENILTYLNNLSSAGEDYCSSTNIRGGWTLVDCSSGAPPGKIGFTRKTPHETREVEAAPVATPGSAQPTMPQTVAPRAVDPSDIQASEVSILQVRLERPVGDIGAADGQLLVGTLEEDLVGPDGDVLAAAGSPIRARLGTADGWGQPSENRVQLQLVQTETKAADLFGTRATSAAGGDAAEPTIQLTGELVQLSDDSVLSLTLDSISERSPDMRVLDAATTVWMEAFNAGDAVTIAGLSSEDGALLPPNGKAVIGRDAIYSYWLQLLNDSTVRVELINVETVVEGDLGYKAGRFELVDRATGAPVDDGKYMQIWKRSRQGYWELHRDMWNSNRAAADGEAASASQ